MMGFVSCPRTFRPPLSLEASFVHAANPLDGFRFAYIPFSTVFLSLLRNRYIELCVAYAFSGVSKSLFHAREQMLMQRAVYADQWLT